MKCNTFEDLQALGTEKIHERTHISRDKVELVMTKSYGEIGRVQFMGYISILEREYSIDLSNIRQEYMEFCETHSVLMAPKQSVILQSVPNSKPKWVIAGIVFIIILMVTGYFIQGKMAVEPSEEVIQLTSLAVEVVDEVKDINLSENNDINMTNSVMVVENNQTTLPSVSTTSSGKILSIRPTYKVWYGMIDMATNERVQNITSEAIVIDTAKNWLIFLGHGRIEIDIGGEKTVLKDKETIRFICENGILKQISKEEFIERNGGKNW
ncbi:hypothetical protein [Sulfuricurvum sp.]|uniref:hypothetical protein n=1 Tax=Sulfuricurvum sp. TaxID=2025608 RepID=UPI003BB574AA